MNILTRMIAAGALGVAILTLVACSGGSATVTGTQQVSGAVGLATVGATASEGAVATAGAAPPTGSITAVVTSTGAVTSAAATARRAAAVPATGGIAISCSALNKALPAATIAAAVGGTPSAGDPEEGGCEWYLTGPKLDAVLQIHSTTAASESEWLEMRTFDPFAPDQTSPEVKVPDIGGHPAYWDPLGALNGGMLTFWDGVKEVDLKIDFLSTEEPTLMAADQASLTTLANDLTKA